MTTAAQICHSAFEIGYIGGLYPIFGATTTDKFMRKVINPSGRVNVHWMTLQKALHYVDILTGV